MEFHPALYALVFLAGLVFGSFFNVAIYRWPQEDRKEREWIMTPSHCPKCGAQIRWYHNIPLFSYIALGGKCNDCKSPISWRYPAVELGTALLWLASVWLTVTYGLAGVEAADISWVHLLFVILFVSMFYLTIIIDAMTQIIPDEISIALFIGAWSFLFACAGATLSPGWQSSLIGMFALAALFFIFAWFGGMGMGDVKLAAGLGALFGWQLTVVSAAVAIFSGGIIAIILIVVLKALGKYRRGIPIPFGPYLALGALVTLFWGDHIKDWYLSLF
jgi:leader peptidase (prepilin peptidase)/N-methyltransferase